jgi:hypothetical protein
VNKAREESLRNTTKLPKAGQVNLEYLKFLDQVVEIWKIEGSPEKDVNDVIQVSLFLSFSLSQVKEV